MKSSNELQQIKLNSEIKFIKWMIFKAGSAFLRHLGRSWLQWSVTVGQEGVCEHDWPAG